MLVIKDNVDLEELEKYGFKYCHQWSEDGYVESTKYYMRYDYSLYIMKENRAYKTKDRAVKVNSASYETMSLLYHLITNGFIEDAKEEDKIWK